MPAAVRQNIDKSAGHCFVPRAAVEGSPNVIVGGWPKESKIGGSVRAVSDAGPGDLYPMHNCGDQSHEGRAAEGSPTVIVNGHPMTRIGDDIDCGDVASGGSPTVFVGDQSYAGTYPADKVMHYGDDLDAGSPALPPSPSHPAGVPAQAPGSAAGSKEVDEYLKPHVESGVISKTELEQPAPAKEKDPTPAPPSTGPVATDCAGFAGMQFPDSFVLTPRTTLGTMTKSVTFPHQVVANMGLPVHAIVCNLKMLAINCWDPIKAQYPYAFITNSFRPNQGRSQHNIGEAMDIQFRNIQKKDYFTIAQWVRDNIQYDQLLLEFKTTGSGLPWIHVSFHSAKNRKQVLTLMNDKTAGQGLIQMA